VEAASLTSCNRARYEREQCEALEVWDAHLARLVAGEPAPSAKIVDLRRRA
jgi:hypothetical protein